MENVPQSLASLAGLSWREPEDFSFRRGEGDNEGVALCSLLVAAPGAKAPGCLHGSTLKGAREFDSWR